MLVIYYPPSEEPVTRVYYARAKDFQPSGTSGKPSGTSSKPSGTSGKPERNLQKPKRSQRPSQDKPEQPSQIVFKNMLPEFGSFPEIAYICRLLPTSPNRTSQAAKKATPKPNPS